MANHARADRQLVNYGHLTAYFAVTNARFRILCPEGIFRGVFLASAPSRDDEEGVSPFVVLHGLKEAIDARAGEYRVFAFVDVIRATRPEDGNEVISAKDSERRATVNGSRVPVAGQFSIRPFAATIVIRVVKDLDDGANGGVREIVFVRYLKVDRHIFAGPIYNFLVIRMDVSLPFVEGGVLSKDGLTLFAITVYMDPDYLGFRTIRSFPFRGDDALGVVARFVRGLVVGRDCQVVRLYSVL